MAKRIYATQFREDTCLQLLCGKGNIRYKIEGRYTFAIVVRYREYTLNN
jgi:hypothetical protein